MDVGVNKKGTPHGHLCDSTAFLFCLFLALDHSLGLETSGVVFEASDLTEY